MRHISNRIFLASLVIVTITTVANESARHTEEGMERSTAAPAFRSSAELVGNWRFQIDMPDVGEKENWQATTFDRSEWTKVEVPKAWDLFDDALWGYEGVGWYSTELPAALATKGKVQRLKFGRVNYHAKVWLNGQLLGENLNGYLPFEFDVTGRLLPDSANQMVVRVDNTARLTWLPGAKKIEWMSYGGILEPVVLETSPQVYISDLTIHAVPNGAGAIVDGTVEMTSRATEATQVTLRTSILGQPGPQGEAKLTVSPGGKSVQKFSIALPQAIPWSPEKPNLYTLNATIEGGRDSDSMASRFGIRKIETHGRDILINGQKFFAKGVNRYDEYGRYGPRPPRELLLADIRRMKRTGINMVRVHYPQSPEILSLYDEMGIVLSEEVTINWWGNNFSDRGDEVLDESILTQAMPALERMIQRDKNHPCVIIWSMANESQTAKPAGIEVMRKLIHRAKELDPSRLTTFVISTEDAKPHAAYEDADLVAINVYLGTFGRNRSLHAGDLGERVTRPATEHIRRQGSAFPDKPVLVTEFGTWGVPGMHGDMVYTEDHQAALIEAVWHAIQDCKECSGGILWCWADYYHRRTFNDNGPFGCFGVVTVDRRPKAALTALARMYGGHLTEEDKPAQ
ncbi:MAG TPA: glycoside hydrolase family 2 TIM barrel-domain containing protein [Terriglobia bacterium]|nr:glycoside hydrolase family 2 TIM barrel-domain containing protein [Terriglobia bacterium]